LLGWQQWFSSPKENTISGAPNERERARWGVKEKGEANTVEGEGERPTTI
jgi:hypothetical protein